MDEKERAAQVHYPPQQKHSIAGYQDKRPSLDEELVCKTEAAMHSSSVAYVGPGLGFDREEKEEEEEEEEEGSKLGASREHVRVAVRARPLLNLQKDTSAWLIDSKR